MKNILLKLIFLCLTIVFSNFCYSANLLLRENFEAGSRWQYYDNWTEGVKQDMWIITTKSPHSGSYCGEGKWPTDNNATLSTKLPTDVSGIFIRYWFKASSNMNYCRFQPMRFTAVSGSNEIEIGGSYPCETNNTQAHIYAPGFNGYSQSNWGALALQPTWNEYAIYINYSANEIMWWKNASSYTRSNAAVDKISEAAGPYRRVSLGAYYKSRWPDAPQNWTFYVDDVEIWDGIPSSSNSTNTSTSSTSSTTTNPSGSTTNSDTSGSTSGSTPPGTSDPSGTIIIDNGDTSTEASGSWSVSNFSSTYGTNSVYSNANASTYSFEAACTGAQKVYLWYTASGNRCTNVPVEIYDGNTRLDTITVNQQKNGGQWNELGTYSFSGTARIITTSNGGCITSADAVSFVPTSSTGTTTANSNNPPPPPPGKPYVLN